MDVIAPLLGTVLAAPGQQERLLRLHTPLGPEVLVAEALHGHEQLSGGGFCFELTALSVDAHLDLDALLGQPLLLELLTADSRTALRPFHGHVTLFEQLGSNGGLARYRLRVEPWLALLRQRVDSYVFQDKTVMEIVEDVFADYVDAGALVPAWRWDLNEAALYPKRSLTTQYQEDDLGFLERLLADEGLFYWFEHQGAAGTPTLGAHTLVIADHNAATAELGPVRYHRADATERADSLQQWSPAHRLHTGRLQRASWDYRSLGLRPASAEAEMPGEVIAEDIDTAGPYAWTDSAHGERLARRQIEGLQAAGRIGRGGGCWRRLAAGGRFSLSQHPQAEGGEHLCVRVEHSARNNLGAEIFDALEQALGPVALPGLELPDALGGAASPAPRAAALAWGEDGDAPTHTGAAHEGAPHTSTPHTGRNEPRGGAAAAEAEDTGFYRNHFHTLPAGIAYRPRSRDGHGTRLHPKPTVYGTQSAIVVSDGAPLQTDRDHRIQVQFAWQRGRDGSGQQPHPGGDDNAPGRDGAWTWVRVASAWAGDNWGGVLLPRAGQEVLVAFLEGDIDRPVVVGSVYNGQGQADAGHNRIAGGGGGATGNAAAWFDGNQHAAVFTGFKSQALADSQTGSGGYQHLRLDDSPGQGRAQASTTPHATTPTMGHLKAGVDNVRGAERGFGAELATQANGAIRAGSGLLLTTEPGAQQLAAPVALAQLAASSQLLQALADTAASQDARLPDDGDTVPAQDSLAQLQDSLAATQHGSSGHGTDTSAAAGDSGTAIGGGAGEVPGWSAPHLLGSSPAGIVSLTPADQVWVSGSQTTLAASDDLNWLSQAGTVIAAGGGIVLFTQGSAPPAGKPNQETGIALHAAQGAVSARAHTHQATVAARHNITVASTQAEVEISAPAKHVLLTAQGAYLKLDGDNIELGAPGSIEFKGSLRELDGPMGASGSAPVLGEADFKGCAQGNRLAAESGAATVDL